MVTAARVTRAPGTVNRYVPLSFVDPPSPNSGIETATPAKPLPPSPVTFPVIVAGCCAASATGTTSATAHEARMPRNESAMPPPSTVLRGEWPTSRFGERVRNPFSRIAIRREHDTATCADHERYGDARPTDSPIGVTQTTLRGDKSSPRNSHNRDAYIIQS